MTIFSHTLKRIFSSKLKLAIVFLCPALVTAIFMSTSTSSLKLLVVDRDGTELSQALVERLRSMDASIDVQLADENAIDDKILCYQADEALIIPEGFEETVLRGGVPAVQEFYVFESEGVYFARASIDGFVSDMRALAASMGHDRARFRAALGAYSEQKLTVQAPPPAENLNAAWTQGGLGFLVQFMLYMSVITAGVVLEDRSSGAYYRTFFAPVSLKRYFIENLLAFLCIGILQAAVSLAMLALAFGMDLVSPAAIFALYAVFALVCIALGMWLITFFRKPMYAYLSVLFLTTPLVMLGGCYWPTSYMPDIIVRIAKFLPTSWVMQAVDKVLNAGAGLGGIGLEILVLLLFAAVFMAAGLGKKVDIAR
jgi:ABC-2 type transport system permease protein